MDTSVLKTASPHVFLGSQVKKKVFKQYVKKITIKNQLQILSFRNNASPREYHSRCHCESIAVQGRLYFRKAELQR